MGSSSFNKRRAEGRDYEDKLRKIPQAKVQRLNPINTISYVQILGTGMDTHDTSPSVLLFFDNKRIVFNAGEGFQRYCTEYKIKLSKIDQIFLTRVCSETAGGLPGLLLTLDGLGNSIKLWGPPGFDSLVDAMRSFIPNTALDYDPTSNADSLINDEVLKLSAILITPGLSSMKDDSRSSLDEETGQLSMNEEVLKPGDISVIFVCELPEIQGKFDPSKATSLGLRPGPKYRQLQLGKSVKSDTQNVMVHPGDVLGPSIPGPIVLIVDCPTPSHLQEVLSSQLLTSYYSDVDGAKLVTCIIHLTPSSIAKTAAYQNWMERFGGAQHIMAGHEMKNMEIPILKASARVAARLNYLCPKVFPSPGFLTLHHLDNLVPETNASNEGSVPNIYDAENLLKFHLRPYSQLGLDRSGIPSLLTHTEIVNELIQEIPEIVESVEEVTRLLDGSSDTRSHMQKDVVEVAEPCMDADDPIPNITTGVQDMSDSGDETIGIKSVHVNEENYESSLPSCLENISREDMEIVLLGTGSSQPSKYRNVTSIYMNLFLKGGLLLDCGEGTLGQLIRRYGIRGADAVVRGLKCIWISHIHADHHAGLARILSLRCKLLKGVHHEPLLVIGPGKLKKFLDACHEDLDMQFLDCTQTTKAYGVQTLEKLKIVLEEVGLEALVSFPVVHCPQAFGLVMKAAERKNTIGKTIPGWKLVYSGDTRPCPELIEASRGATVLIHEATFEDGMGDKAIEKNHSTTSEAIEVGNSAGAFRIILTHFSQRYPKIPVFDDTHMHKTCIGFDLMSINLADLQVLPKVLPYLKLLFRNEMMDDEHDDVEKHGTIHDQVDATLLSKKQKLQKVHMADTTLTYANPSSNLNTSCSTTHESPEKPSTKGPLPRKVGVRAAPPNRRAKVRGAVLQDIDEEESKSKEKDESIQNQLDATLVSEKQNPLTVDMTDETLPDVNRPTNLNISTGSNSYASPEKPSTQGPLSRKVGSRAAPVNRRAKGRGVVLQDTEDDESK